MKVAGIPFFPDHDHREAMKKGIPHNQSLGSFADQAALIAAEEFALSMVPLLMAVNEVGGIAAAIRILRAAKK